MMNDDGQMPENLEQADIVLLGVSRTSKTPTSIYLANRGYSTANVPLVPHVPLPRALDALKKPLIVGLVASAERIIQIRQNRLLSLKADTETEYVDRVAVAEELTRLAPVVRRARLADDRRDAPLDRGDGGGHPRSLPRASHEVHRPGVSGMTADLEPRLPARARLEERDAAASCSPAPACRSRRRRAMSTSARSRRSAAPGPRQRDLATALARAKALAASRSRRARCCLGADQILIARRPNPAQIARLADVGARKLATLAGPHAIADLRLRDRARRRVARRRRRRAELTMRAAATRAALDLYVDAAGEDVLGSVGGYQFEGLGVHLFERVAGDHTTILGLPMLKLLAALRRARRD